MNEDYPTNVENPVALFELFTATEQCGARALKKHEDGTIEILYRESHLEEEESAWDVNLVNDMIVEFAKTIDLETYITDLDANLRPALRDIIQMFWHDPTAEEVKIWGQFPFESVSSGKGVYSLCEPYQCRDIVAGICPSILPIHRRQWRHGSLAASPAPIKTFYKLKECARQKLKAMR